jgi:hypothetical protein
MAFNPPDYTAQRAQRREANMRVLAIPSKSRGAYAGSTGAAQPKGEKAKPGKRTPTKAEREWMDAIVASGCIACRMDSLPAKGLPCAVHHILRGGVRMGHLFTLPLCDPGHHQNGGQFGIVSRHPWKAQFEARYGTELELLARLRAELGATPAGQTA